MVRKVSRGVLLSGLLILIVGVPSGDAAPVRLARHPDYHAGKIAFSYLGDIWTANEDGTSRPAPHRQPRARSLPALLARRALDRLLVEPLRQQRRVRRPGHRRRADAADVPHRQRRSRRLDARFAAGHLPRRARRRRVPERRDAVSDRRSAGGHGEAAAGRLGLLGQLLARRQVARRSIAIPRSGRASTIAAATRPICGSPNLGDKTYTKLLGDERYNRYWPMWGADDAIYFVADPLPNDKSVEAGQPRGPQERQQHLQDSGEGRPAGAGHEAHRRQPVLAVDVERRQGDRLRRQLRHLEARRRLRQDERDQARHRDRREGQRGRRRDASRNEVDAFDISPSGRRAVISARGQILTIATDRGDITRVAPDKMASRNESPKWSPDGKYIAFVSDRSGRDEVWISDPEGEEPEEDHRSRQREGRARLDAGLEAAALHRRRQEALQLHRRRRRRRPSSRRATSAASDRSSVSPDSKWVAFSKQDRTLRSHVYIAPIGGGEERHISDDSLLYSENNAVWTADGRYIVFTSSEGASNGIATQGGIDDDDGAVGAVAARSGSRSDEPRHRQRSAGARGGSGGAAERRPRRRRRRRAGARGADRLERPRRGARGGSRCRARRSAASRRRPRGTRSR